MSFKGSKFFSTPNNHLYLHNFQLSTSTSLSSFHLRPVKENWDLWKILWKIHEIALQKWKTTCWHMIQILQLSSWPTRNNSNFASNLIADYVQPSFPTSCTWPSQNFWNFFYWKLQYMLQILRMVEVFVWWFVLHVLYVGKFGVLLYFASFQSDEERQATMWGNSGLLVWATIIKVSSHGH